MAAPKFNLTRIYQAVGGGGLDFQINTRLTLSSQAHVTIKFEYDDTGSSDNIFQILLELDDDCKYRWDTASTDTISATNDLTLYADTSYQITVPFKLANKEKADLFLHLKQVTSAADSFARFVKI